MSEPRVSFVKLEASHFFALEAQESQRLQYGLDPKDMSWAEAEAVAGNANTWAVMRDGEVLACLGVTETFTGACGVAFAFFARDIGRDHHALTRFARDVVIGGCELPRVEAIVRCADVGGADAGQPALMARCLAEPTPQVRWALAVGLEPVAVLRKFGAASETHMLLERVL